MASPQRAGLGGPPRRPGVWSGGPGTGAICWLSSSYEYQVAQATLARSFPGKFDKFVVPCVVASGDIQDRKGTEPLSFRCSARGQVGYGLPKSHCSSFATIPDPGPVGVSPGAGLGGAWARGRARGAGRQRTLPLQSPQHPIPGALVSSGGTIHHSDLRQRQDSLQLR